MSRKGDETLSKYKAEYELISNIDKITAENIRLKKRLNQLEALNLSKDRYQRIVEAQTELICRCLPDGTVNYTNPAFCKYFGLEGDSEGQEKFMAVISDKDEQYVQHFIQSLNKEHPVKSYQHWVCRADGRYRLVHWINSAILHEDKVVEIQSVGRDVTDIKIMEKEMLRLSQMNLVGVIAASLGHEIRNPMTTVHGMLQMLQMNDVHQGSTEYFDLMLKELDQANAIISEFLLLAKDRYIELEPENLSTILINLLPLMRSSASPQEKRIEVELGPTQAFMVDPQEIRHLILNLVQNGLDAMQATGTITIRTYMESNSVAVLAVQDEGHGIDDDIAPMISVPFYSSKENGTGLGLSVCYGIAERHSAVITYKTDTGGTTFYVRFPVIGD